MSRKALLSSASLLAALCCPAIAHAQTEPDPAASGQVPPNPVPAETPASSTAQSGDIVITGIRGSLKAAGDIKRNSDQIVAAIVAQDIGRFPAPPAAAALQRVPGVRVVVGENNEIVNPLVRGLGDILTTLNGREVFPGGGRGFSFKDIPA